MSIDIGGGRIAFVPRVPCSLLAASTVRLHGEQFE